MLLRVFFLLLMPLPGFAQWFVLGGVSRTEFPVKGSTPGPSFVGFEKPVWSWVAGGGYRFQISRTWEVSGKAEYQYKNLKTAFEPSSTAYHYTGIGVRGGLNAGSHLRVRAGIQANMLLNRSTGYGALKFNTFEPVAVAELGYAFGKAEVLLTYNHGLSPFATMTAHTQQPEATYEYKAFSRCFTLGLSWHFGK